MAKYRKKPVVIDAMQLEGTRESANAILAWIGTHGGDARRTHNTKPEAGLDINTLEGVMRADVGDYIIRGVKGEFYPCKPDAFAATYDAAEKDQAEAAVIRSVRVVSRPAYRQRKHHAVAGGGQILHNVAVSGIGGAAGSREAVLHDGELVLFTTQKSDHE